MHMGDHNVNGGVRKFLGSDDYLELTREVTEPFMRADFAEVIRIMDRRFGESNYSLISLFRDEQRKILGQILSSSQREAEMLYRQIYEHRAPMMRFLTNLHIPLPKAFRAAAEFVLNGYLRAALEQEEIDPGQVRSLLETAMLEGVAVDAATLEFAYRQNLERLVDRLMTDPAEVPLRQLDTAASVIEFLPFTVDLWKIQNAYYGLLDSVYANVRRRKDSGDELAKAWSDRFEALGRKLGVKIG
jgi:hypothetical protein